MNCNEYPRIARIAAVLLAWAILACAVFACPPAPAGAEEGPVPAASDKMPDGVSGSPVVRGIVGYVQSLESETQRISEEVTKTQVVKRAKARAKAEGSATDYCIAVDITDHRTVVMKRKGDGWKVVKYWVCSTGAPDMPTILGSFEVGDRGYSFGDWEGYTCYYWTQFSGNYLFHSVKYEPGTFDIQDGRLGEDVSEGCVRLDIENARWIYDNIPEFTRVITYEHE